MSRMIHLAILGSTRGTDLVPIAQAIHTGEISAKIEIVLSNKPDAYILERAKKYALPCICIEGKGKTRGAYDQEILKELKNYSVDLILLIGWMRILSSEFVRAYPKKIINVHPSLLPAFAGGMDLNVHEEVIKANIRETGCTIHYVDEGVDSGEIILQKTCEVLPSDTPNTLKDKVQKLEGRAFIEVIKNFQLI